MKNIDYTITFVDYWHIGSGLSGGTDVDQLVLKDSHKLPIIPGKTIKGLIREAAFFLADCDQTRVSKQWINNAMGESSDESVGIVPSGRLFFSDATVSKQFEVELNTAYVPYLYHKVASTKIDKNTGVSSKGSLRKVEVTLPIRLHASILNIEDADVATIENCMQMIKRMGMSRNRGFGRCIWEIKSMEE